MTLAELGAKLREAREARDLTVADVADRLKVPTRILQGVEDGSDRVPRTVYVRHYIKDYAKLVGFSASETAQMLDGLEGFEHVNRPVIADQAQYTSVKPSLLPAILGAVLKAVLLLAVVGGGYMAYLHFFANREAVEPVPMPSAVESPAEKSAAEPPAWEVPAPSAEQAETPAPEAAPAQAVTPPAWEVDAAEAQPETPAVSQPTLEEAAVEQAGAVEQALSPAVQPEAEVAEPAVQTEAPGLVESAALPAGTHQVQIIADMGDCWMGFEPDGKKQQRTLRKGDTYSLAFREALTLRLGNAQAVRIVYDGRELERSSSHRVLTLTFPPAE